MVDLTGILLHFLWQAALIGGAAAIALRLAGPASRVRYRIAIGALGIMTLAPVATQARRAGLFAGWGVVTTTAPIEKTVPTSSLTASPPQSEPAGNLTGPKSNSRASNALEHRAVQVGWLPGLWLLGSTALLFWLGFGILRVRRIRNMARLAGHSIQETAQALQLTRRGGVPVLVSPRTDSPFACGWFRPAVVLPEGLSEEIASDQLRAVLAHELAHVHRRDYAVNLGQRVIEALFFFHPVVHWISRIARNEREHCCDEVAARTIGDHRTIASALLALEEARGPGSSHALLPAAGGGSLVSRIERLLAPEPAGTRGWAVAAFVPLLVGGSTLVLSTPVSAPATAVVHPADGAVVWSGELHPGERLKIRNLIGAVRVMRASGVTGLVRARLSQPLPDLAWQVTRGGGDLTVCALRSSYGRCDADGSTWFGTPAEMHRARIDLTVELPAGVSLTAASFEGDLELDGVDSDIEARTGTGMISARVLASRSSPRHTLDFHTGDGTVRLELPTGFGGQLETRLPAERGRSSLGPGDNLVRVSSGRGDLILSRH
jgi:beta-lactamase regulating signal transducer with metallopeptidase domain